MVPGALEVPVALQAMAERDEYDALIALGCIIRGETYHFELVANESGAGVTRLALDYQIPIANAIITTENLEQAIARQTRKGRGRRPRGRGNGQLAGGAVSDRSRRTPSPPPAPAAHRHQRHRARARPAPNRRRSRAREFALQALYQHLVGGNDASRHRPIHARPVGLSQGRRGALRRAAARLHHHRPQYWTR